MHGPDKNASAPSPAAAKYPGFLTVFPSIMLPMFLAVVDQTIVATALPAIAAATGDVQRASWIVVAYLIAATIAAPIYGRLGDAFGRRRLMFAALAVFIVASILCAVGADDRAADARASVAGARRRRPDDAVAGADRGVDTAARACALPGLSCHGGDCRQYLRSGGRRLSHRAFRLAVDLSDQCTDRAGRGRADLAAAAAQIGRASPLARRPRRLDLVHRVRGDHAAGA